MKHSNDNAAWGETDAAFTSAAESALRVSFEASHRLQILTAARSFTNFLNFLPLLIALNRQTLRIGSISTDIAVDIDVSVIGNLVTDMTCNGPTKPDYNCSC
jgi:hypothetical protein